MEHSADPSKRLETVGAMCCKECGGDVFSVADLEDQTPITCDRCGSVVGRWADVRALTHIPEKDVLDKTGGDVFGPTYRGVAELSLVGVD
jgi:hypothetical protein